MLALAGADGGHLAAGELLLKKVGACDLARAHFASGWARRPGPNAVACALHLLRLDLESGDVKAVRPLLDEADAFFAGHGDLAQAGRFYNELAVLAGLDVANVAAAREELRDRALLGIAGRAACAGTSRRPGVRTWSRPCRGRPDAWPAAVISDAELRHRRRDPAPRPRAAPSPANAPRRAEAPGRPGDRHGLLRGRRVGRGLRRLPRGARSSSSAPIGPRSPAWPNTTWP